MDAEELLLGCTGFDWDDGNRDKNLIGHQVTSSECEEIFFNQPLVVADDVRHSKDENRHYALGQTNSGRLLFLVFTVRTKLIRVISARDMSRKERKVYAGYEN
ncbi:MAG: BrnT family toxin [Blastocatellales bacterium]